MNNNTVIIDSEPIHGWFELSYCSYLVLPRSVLQSAPVEWQSRFVKCLNELGGLFGRVPIKGTYVVQLKDEDGKFISDYFRDYERGRRRIPSVLVSVARSKKGHREQ